MKHKLLITAIVFVVCGWASLLLTIIFDEFFAEYDYTLLVKFPWIIFGYLMMEIWWQPK
jgi:hypothetical protein